MINTARVEEILLDTFVKDSDHVDCGRLPYDKVVIVKGIINSFVLHKERLESYRGEIQLMVDCLVPELKYGISFMNMCMDKDNSQWGEHVNSEQLLCLAKGLDIVEYVLPEEMWQFLPGSMPIIKLK